MEITSNIRLINSGSNFKQGALVVEVLTDRVRIGIEEVGHPFSEKLSLTFDQAELVFDHTISILRAKNSPPDTDATDEVAARRYTQVQLDAAMESAYKRGLYDASIETGKNNCDHTSTLDSPRERA